MSGVEPVRIAMWSGPRNISTAMMRSFENRPDTTVIDEPFYAAYLAATGADHPLRDAVLASQPTDWRTVADALTGPVPAGAAVFYQKHMTHHMVDGVGLDWMASCRNVFLIRRPDAVVASYGQRREAVSLEAIGVERQAELFDREADRLGRSPVVIDSADVLADPRAMLSALCAELGIAFSACMLSWPSGKRATDGVWGPAWYDQVERSTGFQIPSAKAPPELSIAHQRIADAARPHYDRLARWRITSSPDPGQALDPDLDGR
jgi:hypothetical protein